jgi:hypothetical protein
MDMGFIEDESNFDLACAPFLFQSFRQAIAPFFNEGIIA